MLSPYQASPHQGHLEQVYHIFAYLKYKPKLTLYFDPKHPPIDPIWFANGDDWLGTTSGQVVGYYWSATSQLLSVCA